MLSRHRSSHLENVTVSRRDINLSWVGPLPPMARSAASSCTEYGIRSTLGKKLHDMVWVLPRNTTRIDTMRSTLQTTSKAVTPFIPFPVHLLVYVYEDAVDDIDNTSNYQYLFGKKEKKKSGKISEGYTTRYNSHPHTGYSVHTSVLRFVLFQHKNTTVALASNFFQSFYFFCLKITVIRSRGIKFRLIKRRGKKRKKK